ncbi:hypothetical protein BDW22DRAFT_1001697 [Trametopsis cervina]|nr:hypothetical protein BDW22DRAFT_1001697 [Trametopsis cervina]
MMLGTKVLEFFQTRGHWRSSSDARTPLPRDAKPPRISLPRAQSSSSTVSRRQRCDAMRPGRPKGQIYTHADIEQFAGLQQFGGEPSEGSSSKDADAEAGDSEQDGFQFPGDVPSPHLSEDTLTNRSSQSSATLQSCIRRPRRHSSPPKTVTFCEEVVVHYPLIIETYLGVPVGRAPALPPAVQNLLVEADESKYASKSPADNEPALTTRPDRRRRMSASGAMRRRG